VNYDIERHVSMGNQAVVIFVNAKLAAAFGWVGLGSRTAGVRS